jgi:pimeloyl-ACP methyl ester carboxylesterase
VKRAEYPIRLASGGHYVATVERIINGLKLEDCAARVACSTLIVCGGLDRLAPPEQGRRLAASMRDAQVVTIPRETHFTATLDPACATAIISFLRAQQHP